MTTLAKPAVLASARPDVDAVIFEASAGGPAITRTAEIGPPAFVSAEPVVNMPREVFYWSVFDAGDVPPGRRDGSHPSGRAILDERFQLDLPLPVAALAISFHPIAKDRVLACALPIDLLETEMAKHAGALRLGPDGVPPGIVPHDSPFDAAEINLLVGEYEPQVLCSLRMKAHRVLVASLGLLVVIVGSGLRWRSTAIDESLTRCRAHTEAVLRELAVALPSVPGEYEPVHQELSRVRSRLAATHGPGAAKVLPPDASAALAALLSIWPTDLETRANRISINENGISLVADVPDQTAADTFDRALATAPGWELQPPQAIRNGPVVQVSATLKPGRARLPIESGKSTKAQVGKQGAPK